MTITTDRPSRIAWSGFYLLLILAPLGVALVADPFRQPRSGLTEASVALGFLAFTVVVLQFALVSRFERTSRRFGGDALLFLHRGIGVLALVLVLAHGIGTSLASSQWQSWNPAVASPAMRLGLVAAAVSALVIGTSLFRRNLALSYETWQFVHLVGASLIVLAAAGHILGVADYAGTGLVRWTVIGYVAIFAGLLTRHRILRPLRLGARPWAVVANRDIGGRTRLLTLRPDGHAGLSFEPGQFAWLLTGRSTFWAQHHPLSIASSAVQPAEEELEFAVKAIGDWSRHTVPTLGPGTRLWVDGPFGSFTPAAAAHGTLVLIAGGVGIAPMRSILLSLADQGDRRPILLFHGASRPSRALFVEEIDRLKARLHLRVVRVFESGDTGWTGERGFITREILARHLPVDALDADYFLCGPPPMIQSVEQSLRGLRVPSARIHTEQFQVV